MVKKERDVRRVRGSSTGRPMMVLLDYLGRRWALRVLWELRSEEVGLNFNELQRRCNTISPDVLSRRLRELGDIGLVTQSDTGSYRLSAAGRSLEGPLMQVDQWAKRHIK